MSIILALSKRLMRRRKYHIWVTNQDWAKRGPPRLSAYVGTSVMADYTRLRIMPAMHYACFAPFWRFGKSRWVSPCPVRAPSVSPRTSEYVYESESESSHLRESESTRARKRSDRLRLSRRRRIIFLSPRCALFRRAHRRVHHPPSLRFDAPRRFDFCYRSRARN